MNLRTYLWPTHTHARTHTHTHTHTHTRNRGETLESMHAQGVRVVTTCYTQTEHGLERDIW